MPEFDHRDARTLVHTPDGADKLLSSRRTLAASALAGMAGLLAAHQAAASTPALGSSSAKLGAAGHGLTIDVMAFGAMGDGVKDDAAAINEALDAVRAHHAKAGRYPIGCRLVLPAGVYVIDSPLNFTNLRAVNTLIDGCGSVLVGRCAGQPVIDALGARWLTMRDLTILSDPAAVPSIGLQIGRTSGIVADDHHFEDLKIVGNFALTCLYNRGAETTEFNHLLLWNDQPGSFCLIQDGLNHFDVPSAFIATDIPRDKEASFNENLFINCDFRHGVGGTPVWLGDTSRHAFIRCYSATNKGPSFIIYCGSNSHTMLDIDCHCETEGLEDIFLFSSAWNMLRIRGFSYRDHTSFAQHAVFACDPHISQVDIEHAQIDVAGYQYQTCRFFANPAHWKVSGTYYSSDVTPWNGNGAFTGSLLQGGKLALVGSVDLKASAGPTSDRPGGLVNSDEGLLFLDKSIGKLLIWSGSGWMDTNGQMY
jgi:hypothetical protein